MNHEYDDIKTTLKLWNDDLSFKKTLLEKESDENKKNQLTVQITTLEDCINDISAIVY